MNNSVNNIINKYTKGNSNSLNDGNSPKKSSPKKSSPKKSSPKKSNNNDDTKKRDQSFNAFLKTYKNIKSTVDKSGENLAIVNEKKQQAKETINISRSKAGISRFLKSGLSLGYWKNKNINNAKENYKSALVKSKSKSLQILSELDSKNANLVRLIGRIEKKIKDETNEKAKYKYKAGIFENEAVEKKIAENKIKKAQNILENVKKLKIALNIRKKEAKKLANATK